MWLMTARLPNRRGSLNIDDEGTPTQRNVFVIEDGIMVGMMQDRLNARLMGVPPTRQWQARILCALRAAADDQYIYAWLVRTLARKR